jgi:hypothetical protein
MKGSSKNNNVPSLILKNNLPRGAHGPTSGNRTCVAAPLPPKSSPESLKEVAGLEVKSGGCPVPNEGRRRGSLCFRRLWGGVIPCPSRPSALRRLSSPFSTPAFLSSPRSPRLVRTGLRGSVKFCPSILSHAPGQPIRNTTSESNQVLPGIKKKRTSSSMKIVFLNLNFFRWSTMGVKDSGDTSTK